MWREVRHGVPVEAGGALSLLLVFVAGCASEASAPIDEEELDAGTVSLRCQPRVDGPGDVLEGNAIALHVDCGEGAEIPAGGFAMDSMPQGAVFDAAEGTMTWTPSLDQAGMHALTLRFEPTGQEVPLRISVLDRWQDDGNLPVDPLTYTEELGLPVIHLGVSPEIDGDEHRPATFVYAGHAYHDVNAKYRGNTSSRYPKRSYTIKFSDDDEFTDVERGFFGKRRIVLTSTFDDNSYLRQRLAYHVWNELDDAHVQIGVFNAVVFVDGEYVGLYLVSDHIDDELMAANGLSEEGNLYKSRAHSANFRLTKENGKPKSNIHQGLTKEEGEPPHGEPGAYDDLDELITWVDSAYDDDFYAGIDARLARNEFEAWWIFTTLIVANDSLEKNAYFYHDPRPEAPDARFHYIPWDFNASFGQSYRTVRIAPHAKIDPARNRLFERLLADPRLAGPLRARMGELLRTRVGVDKVLSVLDTWIDEISAAARRDEDKWGERYRDFWDGRDDLLEYAEEAEYVRDWIRQRWAVLAESP